MKQSAPKKVENKDQLRKGRKSKEVQTRRTASHYPPSTLESKPEMKISKEHTQEKKEAANRFRRRYPDNRWPKEKELRVDGRPQICIWDRTGIMANAEERPPNSIYPNHATNRLHWENPPEIHSLATMSNVK